MDQMRSGPAVTEVLGTVVLPVLRQLTRDGEVDGVEVGWVDGELLLAITLRGETFRDPVWAPSDPPWSPETARERIASDLQDFIAESRFGWGQQRATGGPFAG